MKDEASQNPYRPPESHDTSDVNTPGPAAMMLVGVASIAAGVFALFATCCGIMFTVQAAGKMNSPWVAITAAAAGLLLPLPATFLVMRYVRRKLTARFMRREGSAGRHDV